jgi:hypothetical protein
MTTGQRVTLLKIDDAMALTHRYELEVRSVLTPPVQTAAYHPKTRLGTVRQKGKRKEFYLDLATDDILLDGWNVPFKADTECNGVMSGNACYNLVGNAEDIRRCIETKALWPVSESAKAKILASAGPRTKCDDSDEELLYPNIETHHAVIRGFKERKGI